MPISEPQLPDEAHIACERTRWEQLRARLHGAAPNEACVFVLTRPSRGDARITALLGEALWPNDGEVKSSPYKLELHADYVTRALDTAIDRGPEVGLTLIHTHPDNEFGGGVGRFSPRDDWYDRRLFDTICRGRPRAISASVVLGATEGTDGRLWWDHGDGLRCQMAQCLRIVGDHLKLIELADSRWTDHPEPDLMDRSTRIWGLEGQRVMQNLRVGVVGAGGTGSIAIMSLATMGVGAIRAWDKDIVKRENLHRLFGVRRSDVGRAKVLAIAEAARDAATARPFKIEPIVDWGTSAAGLRGLKDCDIIFSNVDKFAPRVPLNALAYQHLIPVVDMASWLHPNNGVIDAIMTQSEILSPGIPCAWCNGTLSSRKLLLEAQGAQRNADFRVAYGLPFEATDGVEPSVLPLNLGAVGVAMIMFMQVALRITARTPRRLKLMLPEWELDESDLDALPECGCIEDVALGELRPIRPIVPED